MYGNHYAVRTKPRFSPKSSIANLICWWPQRIKPLLSCTQVICIPFRSRYMWFCPLEDLPITYSQSKFARQISFLSDLSFKKWVFQPTDIQDYLKVLASNMSKRDKSMHKQQKSSVSMLHYTMASFAWSRPPVYCTRNHCAAEGGFAGLCNKLYYWTPW